MPSKAFLFFSLDELFYLLKIRAQLYLLSCPQLYILSSFTLSSRAPCVLEKDFKWRSLRNFTASTQKHFLRFSAAIFFFLTIGECFISLTVLLLFSNARIHGYLFSNLYFVCCCRLAVYAALCLCSKWQCLCSRFSVYCCCLFE